MIKVTVGEQEPQGCKPFPKLMTVHTWIGYFTSYGVCLWIEGPHAGEYVEGVDMSGLKDYNKPVTLQNS